MTIRGVEQMATGQKFGSWDERSKRSRWLCCGRTGKIYDWTRTISRGPGSEQQVMHRVIAASVGLVDFLIRRKGAFHQG